MALLDKSEEDNLSRRHSDTWQSDSWRVKVDDDISGLSKKMAGFESVLSNVAHGMDALSAKFDKMQSAQLHNSKTQWPVIFGVLTVVGIIMGGVLGGYVRDLTRIETHTERNTDQIVAHEISNDPHRVGQLFDAKLNDFRVGLRREIRITEASQIVLHAEIGRRLDLVEKRQFNKR